MENQQTFVARGLQVVPNTGQNPLTVNDVLFLKVTDDLLDVEKPADIVNSDREMISKLIGLYSFAFGVLPLMRYTAALNTSIQSLLIKASRFKKYQPTFEQIDRQWEAARLAMQNELDYDLATCAFTRIEKVLKIIAERENLTMHRVEYFDGRFMATAESVEKDKVAEDPFAR